jgi:hypothetical protein
VRWSFIPAALVLASCGGSPPTHPVGPPVGLDGSWLQDLLQEPDHFSMMVDATSRQGWAAFHRHDYTAALGAFTGSDPSSKMARLRTLVEIADLQADMARAGDYAWKAGYNAWRSRRAIPDGSALPLVAGLAALDAGRDVEARSWFVLASAARDPDVAALAGALSRVRALALVDPNVLFGSAPGRKVAAHLAARSSGDATPLLTEVSAPFLQETFDGVVHRYADPLLLRTLAIAARDAVDEASGGISPPGAPALLDPKADPLSALLFGPVLRLSDVSGTDLGPTLASLDVTSLSGAEDDPEQALGLARTLDQRLDAWSAERFLAAPPAGQALYDDLQLGAVWHSSLLLAVARDALKRDHPRQALALAWSALDLERSGEITPTNHPALSVVIAQGQLETGHGREALDALQPLLPTWPALGGLYEAVSDLAVLEGLSRYGDSKE